MNKCTLIFCSIVFIASACSNSDNNQTTIANDINVGEKQSVEKTPVDLFFPLTNVFDWASFEKQDQETKTRFVNNIPDGFEFYTQHGGMSVFDEGIRVVDFNGDGLNDIIFTGYFGGEAEQIHIFINTGTSFEKIFTEIQQFHKVVFENGKVKKMYIQDGGCCCEYLLTNKIFSVDYGADLPRINLISQMQFLNNSVEEYPDSYFEKPIKFEVLNDGYNIRFSPVIDDQTEVWYCGEPHIGNSLGKINSGSVGYALAKKTDLTGRVWWFVAMHPNSQILEAIYYDDDFRPNTYKLGWISSRFVKEIDD